MQGLDGGLIQVGYSPFTAFPGNGIQFRIGGRIPFQPFPDAVAQFGGGGFGKGDGGDLIQGSRAAGNQVGDPPHQAGGLAGAGPGFNEKGIPQPGQYPLPGGIILRYKRGGHSPASSGSASCR